MSLSVGSAVERPHVYITRNVPIEAVDKLKESFRVCQWESDDVVPRDVLLNAVSDIDALFCLLTDKIDKQLLDAAPKLRVIGTMSVGYDHIDVEECQKRSIQLGYTPDVLTESTAELTMALLLCTSRRLIEANKLVTSGGWGSWRPLWLCGNGLVDSVVGIVGLGRIGLSVAQKLIPFRPSKILYCNRKVNEQAKEYELIQHVSFDELIKTSDFVLICCSLTDDTKLMFNAKVFEKMKSTAILINTSRGGLVDQAALYDALRAGTLGAAGLDVCTPEPLPTNSPLLALDNCVVLPHIGSATTASRTQMAMLTACNIHHGLMGLDMPAPLTF